MLRSFIATLLNDQEMLIHLAKKKSVTTFRRAPQFSTLYSQGFHKLLGFFEHLGIQRVIDPSAFSSVSEDACVLQRFQMKRETGLTGRKHIRQITDALLTFAEPLQNLQARLIGQGMEPSRSGLQIFDC
jgi:hypothetical protein